MALATSSEYDIVTSIRHNYITTTVDMFGHILLYSIIQQSLCSEAYAVENFKKNGQPQHNLFSQLVFSNNRYITLVSPSEN